MQLAGEASVRRHVEEQLQASEQTVFHTRLDAENRVQHTLFEQRKRQDEQTWQQEKAVAAERNSRAWDPTRAEALSTLRAYATLWRCACTPYAGLHGRQAEQAVRSLMQVSNLLPPASELVQEPLRRAVGDRAAKDIGEALASEAAQGLGPGPLPEAGGHARTEGSWCHWEGAPMAPRRPLGAYPPILQSQATNLPDSEFG